MRKITKLAIQAFNNAVPFKKSNMEVAVLQNVTVLRLHDNEIAYRYNDPKKTLSISTCGWNTPTTKERLNALEGVRLCTKKGVLYLNGNIWDGNRIDIN